MNSAAENTLAMAGVGEKKAKLSTLHILILGFLAGICIALGGVGATIAGAAVDSASLGKLMGAAVFPTGLAVIVFTGAELFTGNCLMVISLADKRICWGAMLRNWALVYIGNLLGSLFVAAMVVFGHTISLFSGAVATSVISTALGKATLSFGDAFLRGIGCNLLVCAAVWMATAAKSAGSKVISLYLPVMLFVLCGFEHCVANMYFIPAGLFAMMVPEYAEAFTGGAEALTWGAFFVKNLIPVTLGNIVGGSVLLGLPMWFVHLRSKKEA